jgi:KDZ transposase family protein
MRVSHRENPFHRIEQWNGNFFRPAELWEVGTYVLIPHHTGDSLCDILKGQIDFIELVEMKKDEAENNSYNNREHQSRNAETSARYSAMDSRVDANDDVVMENIDDIGKEEKDDQEFIRYIEDLRDHSGETQYDFGDINNEYGEEIDDDVEDREKGDCNKNHYLSSAVYPDHLGPVGHISDQIIVGTYVRVVHTNGIHNIALVSCECRGHDELPKDLLSARLLPTSFDRIRTLFTVQVLDHFRLCNLELKATAYQFHHLIQRLTCPMDPASVVDLYREFRRMSRIWRWMKRLKWAGYGNRASRSTDVAAGELTLFCPACPQPGINIPDNWKEDPARHVFNFPAFLSR